MADYFVGPLTEKEATGPRQWFSNLPACSSPDYSVYFNDFLVAQDYAAADWVITTTEAGAGDATEALAADERGGALLITNDAADNDLDALQLTEETFTLTVGKRTWFETRCKASVAADVDLFIGLAITDTTVLDTTDRVGFQIDDGDASIRALTEKDSVESSSDTGVDAANATYVRLGFYYDGSNKVYFFVDRELKATHTTNIPDDENLCVTFHIQNGSGNARTLTIDYLYACQER